MIFKGKISTKKFLGLAMVFIAVSALFTACKIGYSFTGANLPPSVKTYTVYYFPNRARLISPTLSQVFTEDLKDKLRRQTSLNELQEKGDIEFEGQIVGYDVHPVSIQAEDLAAKNRLTITIKVKYSNNKEPDSNFERTFSGYEDFESSQLLIDVEDELNLLIVKKINEDIFNATIANW